MTVTTTKTEFKFDGDYGNFDQVAAYRAAYNARYAELVAAGQYPYNDSFKGHIDGLVAASGRDEDTAIYLLQGLRHRDEEAAKIQGYLDAGYQALDQANPGVTRFQEAILVHYANKGSRSSQFLQFTTLDGPVRVFADYDGNLMHVLAKGKRNHGYRLGDQSANVLYVR